MSRHGGNHASKTNADHGGNALEGEVRVSRRKNRGAGFPRRFLATARTVENSDIEMYAPVDILRSWRKGTYVPANS